MSAPSLHIEPLALDATALLALAARAPQRYPVLLDSAADGALSEVSMLAALPRQCIWLDAAGQLHGDGLPAGGAQAFLEALDIAWRSDPGPLSFRFVTW